MFRQKYFSAIILIVVCNINDLVVSFKTVDRPFLWQFLSLYVTDNETRARIFFHKPYIHSYGFFSYEDTLTRNYTVHVKLDAIYIIIANLWLLVLYITGTWIICRYARKQLIRQESLSRDNVTDVMTGLYNRKVISWGAYQLLPKDTLEVAMLKADELLYQHKRSKYEERR